MQRRYEELDSLRGLAALFVVLFHMYQVIPITKITKVAFEYSPLRLFISGGESVILFFVLSGFVLSLPYFNNKQLRYSSFILRRICRIYLPYLFALVFAIGCRELLYTGKLKGGSEWINSFWNYSVNIQVLKAHVLMLGTFLSNLNPVIWSLVHEMRISIIFPIVMLLLVKFDWKKGLGLSVIFSIIAIVLFNVFKPVSTGTEYVLSLNYTAMFIVGALIAKFKDRIAQVFALLSNKVKALIFSAGIFTYLFVHPSFAIKAFIYQDISPFYRTVIDSWFVTIGAVILIIFSINSTLMARVLKNYFVNFLGKISYSLYLIHLVIILSMLQVLSSYGVPLSIILIGSLLISFAVASLMYYFIEKPSIKLGKTLTTGQLLRRNKAEKTANRIA